MSDVVSEARASRMQRPPGYQLGSEDALLAYAELVSLRARYLHDHSETGEWMWRRLTGMMESLRPYAFPTGVAL